MSTRVASEFAGAIVAMNSLKICTSASLEACANAAAFTHAILGAGDGGAEVSGTGVANSDGVSFRTERDAAQYPINQWIIAGEPAVSQDHRATDIQRSYVERDRVGFSRRKTDWQFYRRGNNRI